MGTRADEVRGEIEHTRADLGYTLDAIGDRVSPRQVVRRRTRRIAHGLHVVRNSVMGTTGQVTSSMSGMASSARESLGGVASAVPRPDDISEMITGETRGNPLAAGMIAFAGGLLLASVLPQTESERRSVGQLADRAQPLVSAAQEATEEIKGEMKASLGDAVERLRDTATESASNVGTEATQAAGEVGAAAKRAASPENT